MSNPKYMNHKKLCPSCDGEGGEPLEYYSFGRLMTDFKHCIECNGEGYIIDEDASPLEPHYKELDEFDASKEQDIKDSLRDE
jgi:hypothetical protein